MNNLPHIFKTALSDDYKINVSFTNGDEDLGCYLIGFSDGCVSYFNTQKTIIKTIPLHRISEIVTYYCKEDI
jgi:hypothetical protein